MLYNINEKQVATMVMCLTCDHYNKETKHCEGLDLVCFEYDDKTQTIIDGKTKLPLVLKGE